MASVWGAMKNDRSGSKIDGNMSLPAAMLRLHGRSLEWANAGKFRELVVISSLEVHLKCRVNGKSALVGHLWVEPCSPPSVPAGGDRYRNATAKGA